MAIDHMIAILKINLNKFNSNLSGKEMKNVLQYNIDVKILLHKYRSTHRDLCTIIKKSMLAKSQYLYYLLWSVLDLMRNRVCLLFLWCWAMLFFSSGKQSSKNLATEKFWGIYMYMYV